MVAELVSPPTLLYPEYQGEVSSTVPARLPNAAAGKGQGQHSRSHSLGAHGLPEPMPQEPARLCFLVKMWGPLSPVLQTLRGWGAPLCCPREEQGLLSRVLQLVRAGLDLLLC